MDDGGGARPPGRPGMGEQLGDAVRLLGWLSVAAAVAGAAGRRAWPFSLTVHFWPQLAVALVLFVLLAARRRAWWAAGVQGGTALALLAALAPHVPPQAAVGEGPVAEPGAATTFLFANVFRGNQRAPELLERVRHLRPDVVGLAEVDAPWLERLRELEADYPHRVALPRDDNFGIALLSRWPLTDATVDFGGGRVPWIVARVERPSGPVRVVVAHPLPPFSRGSFLHRNAQLAAFADTIRRDPTPTVLIGDLNGTPWSPFVRDFLREAGLQRSGRGLRSAYTWPVGIPVLALGLDYCLHSDGLAVVEYEVVSSIGSDHYPVLCSLAPAPPS